MTSSSEVLGKTKTDADRDYFYIAAESTTLGSVFIVSFNLSDGAIVNSMRQRSNSQQLKIGSFNSPNSENAIAYLGLYSSNDSYSELIKLYFPGTDYVIYQQQCVKFRFQYVTSNESWASWQQTQHIHSAIIPAIGDIMDIVTVTQVANSGLENVTTSNTLTTGTTTFPFEMLDTTTTPSVSDLNYTFSSFVEPTESCLTTTVTSTGNTTDDDDSISTLSIVLIIVCSVLFIIIVVGLAIAVTYCIKKSKRGNQGMSQIEQSEPPVEERSGLKEENKI